MKAEEILRKPIATLALAAAVCGSSIVALAKNEAVPGAMDNFVAVCPEKGIAAAAIAAIVGIVIFIKRHATERE